MTKTIVQAWPAATPIAAGLLLIMAATAVIAVQPARAQAPAPAPAAAPATPQPDAVRVLFETTCSNCHDLSVITGQRKSREDWTVTMENMMVKGAPITDDQARQILEYLVKTYPDKS